MSSQLANPPQYAVKKRRRPQPKVKAEPKAPQKSNPSKRHRDRLNAELDRLSSLIPFPQDVVSKLDKLSILRLAVAYMRNKNYHAAVNAPNNKSKACLPANFFSDLPMHNVMDIGIKSMDGFIIVVTQDFNVFYVTSTVQDYLGFPQSDIINQSMLDYIHTDDRQMFIKQMQVHTAGEDENSAQDPNSPPINSEYSPGLIDELSEDGFLNKSFICRLRCLLDTSSGFLALHFTGHLKSIPGQNKRNDNGDLIPSEVGLFLLASHLHTPSILEIRTKNFIFQTKHKLDYQPLGIDTNGKLVLGYTEKELCQQSGYQFVHSADMMHCADAHTRLMKTGESGLSIFRLLHRTKQWQWVTATARLSFKNGKPENIIVTHRAISDQEGEEHLNSRISAFKFDFTGQACLYEDNGGPPGPPPSNNQSSEKEAPLPEDQRPTMNPNTLLGAAMIQRPEIYNEPKRRDFMFNEFVNPQINIVKYESSDTSQKQDEFSLNDLFFNPPQEWDVNTNNIENILFPEEKGFSPYSDDSGIQGSGSYSSNENKNNPSISTDFSPHSSNISPNGYPEEPNAAQMNHITKEMHNHNIDTSLSNTVPLSHAPPLSHIDSPEISYDGTVPLSHNVFSHTHANIDDFSKSNYAKFHHDDAVNKEYQPYHPEQLYHKNQYIPPQTTDDMYQGIIDSLEITTSRQTASAQQQQTFVEKMGFENITSESKQSLNIECQENLIQVDLDSIASRYQTANPIQVLQNFMEQNPKAAISIKQGFVPEYNTHYNVPPQEVQTNQNLNDLIDPNKYIAPNKIMQAQRPNESPNNHHTSKGKGYPKQQNNGSWN